MTDIEKLPEQIMYEPLFNLVKDPTNWKNPIDRVIRGPHVDSLGHLNLFVKVLTQAIIFYTGSVPEITQIGKDDKGWVKLRVSFAGYYACIGA